MSYTAPVEDLLFCVKELAGLEALSAWPGYEEAGPDTAEAVFAECARFAGEVLAPLNAVGDRMGASWQAGSVTTPPGFQQAFRQFADGGWQGLQHAPQFGGQGLPKTLGAACNEVFNAANLSFALCPLLTDGAIEALLTAGSAEQQQRFLPRMLSGEWTGTMNLTEPQAGSDLGQVRTRAEPQADGRYRLTGSKIFITYGEHDLAANIVHLVLARVAGGPEGVKGLSLFLVPKLLPGAGGEPGERNAVQCVSLEHKLGIHASPTAVLAFEGAWGERVGEENRGLEIMFIMMNAARFAVGIQGVGICERAYQQAVGYARERVQSRPVDAALPRNAPILHHPDVRRMLMTMRALTQACRGMALWAASLSDAAHAHPDAACREQSAAWYEFMVPLVKGYSTETSLEVTSLNIQVHGGMGFIEETGAAQHFRDARILTIYEGTTAIQANDLVGRKTVRDGGRVARALAAQIAETEQALHTDASPEARAMAAALREGRQAFEAVVDFILAGFKSEPNAVFAGSVPYLMLAGNLMAGWQMGRALLAARRQLKAGAGDAGFLQAKIATAHFYAQHLLPRVPSLRTAILAGADSVMALPAERF